MMTQDDIKIRISDIIFQIKILTTEKETLEEVIR